ncbi:MAG: 4-hydroxythreonine-4-phosphate dehydrogenase PdxA [Bacteroidales bacterium]|jgi:4-hydroxythreonine-4-phosphate dehydrogenase|nr:4-hydroxythreonine-4-phosphate dehydrogenase PdxA [Bacteroidales bacterium]MCB9028501.1 4-hydroxythreonine-4-phosphate dehydrogenase PdxA [Bacteroidales bacterium]HNT93994.1 4-hydroxythreonine-4-phosphate dehydrogenase PdxA [Bacteroidales bacterium]HOO67485.1 4-hydroxythreonine-4-phosphate dehydrogenase PdxA [Bacteroidales bacterium]HPE22321.1 4-hydroxythreonine-4-phosphate dehydrogenase PdxA [Bacteroidales bacterium]
MDKKTIIAGITQGDINGIGYEIIMKALSDTAVTDLCVPVVYGSPKVAAYHRKVLNINNFNFYNIRSAAEANPKKVNLVNCLGDDVRVELGKSTPEGGQASLAALESAVADLADGKIDVLVTAPIDKHNIQSDSFRFTGHTDYLKSKIGSHEVLMLMISESMKIGFATEHLPLREVAGAITMNSLLGKIRLLNRSLLQDFAIRGPKIGVLSLNPHAGDGGLLGNEEKDIIIPAITRANEEGILAFGPYSSDGFFGSGAFSRFDAILAMYHDQGMGAFKALAFDTGVNFTAGLPVIRTSPVHGTAFDITGKNEASGNSMRQAIYSAVDIYRNREMYEEITRNPLQPQKIEIHPEHVDELPPEPENDDHHL